MAPARSGGTRHRISKLGFDDYELSWQHEIKYGGSRILHHRTMRRETNRKGAEKFAKKWGCPMPSEPVKAPLHSVPIAIENLPTDHQQVFEGMALYSNGRIAVTFKVPMKLKQVVIGKNILAFDTNADGRIVIDFEPL